MRHVLLVRHVTPLPVYVMIAVLGLSVTVDHSVIKLQERVSQRSVRRVLERVTVLMGAIVYDTSTKISLHVGSHVSKTQTASLVTVRGSSETTARSSSVQIIMRVEGVSATR